MSMIQRHFSVPLRSGLRLTAKAWGHEANPNKILCLHGWLDNAASFNYLGPLMAQKLDAFVCALDFPGHGESDHLSSTFYSTIDYTALSLDFLDELGWDSDFSICGHSMGGGVGMMIAGTIPEKVKQMVSIEGVGLLSKPPSSAPKDTRKATETRRILLSKQKKVYPTIDDAARARVKTATQWPGSQFITFEAARELVERGLQWFPTAQHVPRSLDSPVNAGPLPQTVEEDARKETPPPKAGGYVFRHDSMLSCPTPLYMTEEQMWGYLSDIECATMVIRATQGWPMDIAIAKKRLECIRQLTLTEHEGGHHLHLDPDTREAVGDTIIDFFSAERPRAEQRKTQRKDNSPFYEGFR